jgi:hypothetical protein
VAGQSILLNKLIEYWEKRLQDRSDVIERIMQAGILAVRCDSSALELIAACSLLTGKKPIHEVLKSIELYSIEYDLPGFDNVFFQELQSTLHEFELAGLRSHARKLRKVGQAMAAMHGAKDWQEHWTRERKRKLESAIRDEPFYPQQG